MVTSGTGFIGSYIALDLVAAGRDVVAYNRSTDSRILNRFDVAGNVAIYRGDVTDPIDVFWAVREIDATHIIHLAAPLATTARENPRAALDVNVQGANNVFETARTFPEQVERVAWASLAAVYAPPTSYGGGLMTESDLVHPDMLYGATKEYNEYQVRVCYENFGVSYVTFWPTVIYSLYRETGGSTFPASIVERPVLDESFSVDHDDQATGWQHIRDIAQTFRKATFVSEGDLSQCVYNVRGELATIHETAEMVWWFLPDADLTISGEGELPRTREFDMAQAQADLGYDPEHDLKARFRDYVNVLRREHGLGPI